VDAARADSRRAWDATRREFADFAVWRGRELAAGNDVRGPAIVELAETTVVLSSADRLVVDEHGNFVCDREATT
jgi:N-methylhydantoinase A/oxoprolinase/acetone carboxylase beta subunit